MTSCKHSRFIIALVAASACPAFAQDGLTAPVAGWLWPTIQARITVQTGAVSPLSTASLTRGTDDAAAQRGVQGGAVFGDYVFARPAHGSFRATSGVLVGQLSGAPVRQSSLGSSVGLSVLDSGLVAAVAPETAAQPYLGLGYNSQDAWRGLSVTADLGVAAARAAGLGGVGRALAGQQGWDQAVREMHLTPRVQLGIRYAF